VLDGEIVCLDPDGKSQFRDLLFRRAEPLFYAFDILWDEHASSDDEEEIRRFRNGEDLRYLPLIDRKLRLHAVMPKRGEHLGSTAITSTEMGKGCSGWRASMIWKASWQNERPIHTCWNAQAG
jgi:ATP-dependent DNA ligase